MNKWYQDAGGSTSSMRIMAMMSTVTGCIAVLAGVVALFMGLSDAVMIAGVGAGMAGLGEVAKSWQARNGA